MVSRAAVLLALLGLVALSSTALAQGHGHGHGQDKHHGQGHKEQGVNIEKCKNMGKDAGGKAAQQACDTTMVRGYCVTFDDTVCAARLSCLIDSRQAIDRWCACCAQCRQQTVRGSQHE